MVRAMKVFLAGFDVPYEHSTRREFTNLSRSGNGRHQLVDEPEYADIILFTEWHLLGDPILPRALFQHDLYKSFQTKCYSFDQRPRAYCALPGLYTSVPWKLLRGRFQVPWSYHQVERPQDVLEAESDDFTPDLLFSYVGAGGTHACRSPLLGLVHPEALIKPVEGHLNWAPDAEGYDARRKFFAESVLRSEFVLCPRGRATSSYRFYEVMAAGRVPVVISDDWVPPRGVNLSEFAIWWPEFQTDGLVEHLESVRPRAARMGARAREVFDANFSAGSMWDAACDQLDVLRSTKPWDQFPRFGYPPDRRVARHVLGRVHRVSDRTKNRLRGSST